MTTLYNYQREGVDRLIELGRALCADSPGLGKSIQSLTAAVETNSFPTLVICPASLKFNWRKEAHKHCGLKARILSGTTPEKKPSRIPDVTIVNYDVLQYRMDELQNLEARCIIADEGHYLTNRSAKRTKCTKSLVKKAERAYVLSGTPLTNKPADLWPVLNMLRPDIFTSFISFCHQFAKPRKTPWGWTYDGAKNLPALHKLLLETVLLRRRKEEVLEDLPPKRRIVVPLELEDRKSYEGAKKDFVGWLSRCHPSRLSSLERAKGLGIANRLKQLVGQLKLPSVISWVRDFLESSGSKLLLFAYHRKVVEQLDETFGDRSVRAYGGMTPLARQKAFDAFEENKRVKLLVGQIETVGQGLSCTVTDDCAFAELDWRASLIQQATERTHGVGRGLGGCSTAWMLLAENTIEETLAQTIDRKQEIARQALDGGEGETLDMFTAFCEASKGER